MVDPSIDDVQDDDGVIYTSEVKAKDDEEIQKIVDDIFQFSANNLCKNQYSSYILQLQ